MSLRAVMRWRIALVSMLGAASAGADPMPALEPVISARGGFAHQRHYGDVSYFESNGVMLAVEAGARIKRSVTLLVALERGASAPVENALPYQNTTALPYKLRDVSILAIAEGERDRFVFGGGVGAVVETVGITYWRFDTRGPIAHVHEEHGRNGVIGVARGGVRLTGDRLQVLLVAQLSAQHIDEQRTLRAYGASLGMTVRWR